MLQNMHMYKHTYTKLNLSKKFSKLKHFQTQQFMQMFLVFQRYRNFFCWNILELKISKRYWLFEKKTPKKKSHKYFEGNRIKCAHHMKQLLLPAATVLHIFYATTLKNHFVAAVLLHQIYTFLFGKFTVLVVFVAAAVCLVQFWFSLKFFSPTFLFLLFIENLSIFGLVDQHNICYQRVHLLVRVFQVFFSHQQTKTTPPPPLCFPLIVKSC